MNISPAFTPHESKVAADGAITIIGMAAAGKTTIGRELSSLIGWPSLDTDHVIESVYGVRLQSVTDRLSKEEFLDLEMQAILSLRVRRMVVSTGGSVVYRESAMRFLQTLGPVIYLAVPLPVIIERIARKPERGLAIAPGQTIEDLFHEREALYTQYATWSVEGGNGPPHSYARAIAQWLATPVAP